MSCNAIDLYLDDFAYTLKYRQPAVPAVATTMFQSNIQI